MQVERSTSGKFYAVAELVSIFEDMPNEGKEHLYKSIIVLFNHCLDSFKKENAALDKEPEKKEVQAEEPKQVVREVVEQPEKVVPQLVEQPKRRGRLKKKEESVVEEPAPVEEEQYSRAREINFDSGLEKGLAAYSTIEGVTDDTIVNEKLGPIPLANSLPKQGEHPFFKGPAQFVWYLNMERWPMYLANLLDSKDFYPDQLSLYDAKRFEEAKRVGVDIEFVTALVDKETKRMVSIDDFKEADYADDEKGMEALLELKESGFLKKFVAEIDPEKKLLKFLTRFGQNKHIAEDLQTIYEEHTEHPNKYIHW